MVKILVSFSLLGVGLFVFGRWLSGGHGHLQFRPDYKEDWIIVGLLAGCWGYRCSYLFPG